MYLIGATGHVSLYASKSNYTKTDPQSKCSCTTVQGTVDKMIPMGYKCDKTNLARASLEKIKIKEQLNAGAGMLDAQRMNVHVDLECN